MRLRLFFAAALAVLSSLLPLEAVRALTVLPLSLRQLTDQAGRIFVGRCEEVEAALDEHGMPATYVRFQVADGIKGAVAGKTILVKQFGAARKDLKVAEGGDVPRFPEDNDARGIKLPDRPDYLLFFYPESDLGFTSPVGGGQGAFEILSGERAGLKTSAVLNPLNNRFLRTFREGPVPLDELVGEIRKLVD